MPLPLSSVPPYVLWTARLRIDDPIFLSVPYHSQVHHAKPWRVARARRTSITLEELSPSECRTSAKPVQGGFEWEGRFPRTRSRNYRD